MRTLLLGLLLTLAAGPVSMGAPDGGGIGGTGITGFGPIQGFGSIFVSAREYFLRADTRVTVDGRTAGRRALHVGDIVVVRGTANPARATGWADIVQVRHPLVGRVDAVSAGGAHLTVLGQAVRIPAGVSVVNGNGRAVALQAGDWVAVSALANARGQWIATRVALRYPAGSVPAGAPAVIEGRVASVGPNGVLRIGTQAVRLEGPAGHGPAPGARIRVVGRYRDGAILASRVAPARPALGSPGRYVEMEGYAVSRAAGGLHSNGIVLRPPGGREGAGRPGIRADRALVFTGRIGPDGSLEIERMEPPHAPELQRPDAGTGGGERGYGSHEAHGIERPHVEHPEVERPEIERPEVERPQVEMPQVQRPEIPEVEMPGH
jgi:hypothetical protein